MSYDNISGANSGVKLVLDTAVAAAADKTSSAFSALDVSKGCGCLVITGGNSATAGATLKLQASIDGTNGWYDTSTNHSVAIGSNDWNNTNGFSAGFGFDDVNAPFVRLYLDSGTGMAATNVKGYLWGKP
jgi:hypothetical protein